MTSGPRGCGQLLGPAWSLTQSQEMEQAALLGIIVGVCPQGGLEFLATSSKSAGPQREQELISYRHVRS